MRPSKRDLWRAVDSAGVETPIPEIRSEVVTVTEEESDPCSPPADATVLETESDIVTVWRE